MNVLQNTIENSRREFFTTSASGLGGLALLSLLANDRWQTTPIKRIERVNHRRSLAAEWLDAVV